MLPAFLGAHAQREIWRPRNIAFSEFFPFTGMASDQVQHLIRDSFRFDSQMKMRRPQLLKRFQEDINDLYAALKAEGKA